MGKGFTILILLTLAIAIASAGIASATVLANIKITATFYNYTDGTTYSADFHLKVIDKANDGFDNNDFVLQKLPNGGGYAVLYSNTSDGYSLTIDSYNGTSARKIKLVYAIVPVDTGIVNLTWHVSGHKFKVKLKDYAHDNTYTTAIASQDMMTTSAYSAPQIYTDGLRFFGLESDTYQIPIFFVSPTQASGYVVNGNSYELRINMTNASDMSDFVFNWNGTNYTIYDSSSLVFMANFDNVSSLGESDAHPADLSYYENNMTNNGATWTSSGKYGGAYNFNGVNNCIHTTNVSFGLDGSKSISYGAWVNVNPITADQLVVAKHIDNPADQTYSTYALALKYTGNARCSVQNAGMGAYPYWDSVSTVSSGSWHNIFCSWNRTYGNASDMIMYIDGVSVPTVYTANGYSNAYTLQDTNDMALIGCKYTTSYVNIVNGSIDEVRIWNRSLSADEIKQLYYSNLNKYDGDKWSFYSNQQNLANGATYTYQGYANDYYNGWNSTETRNISIQNEMIAFSLPSNFADFGNMSQSENKVNLTGIQIQNDGTTYLDIEVNASSLFASPSISYPGNNYLFRIGDAGKGNETNGVYNSSSVLSWAQFSGAVANLMYRFNYSTSRNLAALQVNITVPNDEPSGSKISTITITGVKSE